MTIVGDKFCLLIKKLLVGFGLLYRIWEPKKLTTYGMEQSNKPNTVSINSKTCQQTNRKL